MKALKLIAQICAVIIALAGFVGLCGECEHQMLWTSGCLVLMGIGGWLMDKLDVKGMEYPLKDEDEF